MYNTL